MKMKTPRQSKTMVVRGPGRDMLQTVQAARGVAAGLVVLCHAGTILGSPVYLNYVPFLGIFRFGHAGVDFFFVLSGFIISTVHRNDIGRPGVIRSYAWKRLVRIYPIYWLVAGGAIALATFGLPPDPDFTFGAIPARNLVFSLLLLPQHPVLGVAWTLAHEMLFYLIFGLAIVNRPIGLIAFCLWTALTVTNVLSSPPDLTPWAPADLWFGFIGSSYHLQFLLGIAVAVGVRRFPLPRPRLFVLAGIAGLGGAAWLENTGRILYIGYASQALFGLFSAMTLTGLVAGERRGQLRASRLAVFLGAASYSVYLVHVPAMAAWAAWAALLTGGGINILPGWLLMLALAAAAVALGSVIHMAAERPLLRLLHRQVSPLPNGAPVRLGSH